MVTQYILGNDYNVDWPLGTDEWGGCPPSEPPLSDGLRHEIAEWAATFNRGYMPDSGWESEESANAHRRQANRLVALIADELDAGDSIELRYWETLFKRRNG